MRKGPSIKALADRAEVSTRLITKIEADEHYVAKADTMEHLAWKGLGLPVFMVFFPQEYKIVREALFNMFHKQMHAMSPEVLFNMSRLDLTSLANDPLPFAQPQSMQSYFQAAGLSPVPPPHESKS